MRPAGRQPLAHSSGSERYAFLLLAAIAASALAQAPKKLLDALPPSQSVDLATIAYTNPFDQSRGEALVEVPKNLRGAAPLIVTPHAANWTQEMNRSLWSGVAEQFGAIILYPRHQGKLNPRVSFGSPRQLANLTAAIDETMRRFHVDKARIYAGGISQGAIETLLLMGHDPKRFAGGIAINPIADMLAFYQDVGPGGEPQSGVAEPLQKLRAQQWPALHKLVESDFGGTPDTARPEYYLRSPAFYARDLATRPLILYWADDDELIPNGAAHQGGMLAQLIRAVRAGNLHEVKHSGGHGYPFYRIDLAAMTVKIFPRDIFLGSVKQMLGMADGKNETR